LIPALNPGSKTGSSPEAHFPERINIGQRQTDSNQVSNQSGAAIGLHFFICSPLLIVKK
jgi:hypothetical protein